MSQNIIREMEKFLSFDKNSTQDLKILYNYSILASKYDAHALNCFYSIHSNTFVTFNSQKASITEILFNCELFLNQIDDEMYAYIMCNTFIIKNNLNLNHVTSDSSLLEFYTKTDLVKGNELSFFIPNNPRNSNLINSGKIPPFTSKLNSNTIKLNKCSFKYLINHDIDIPELMIYPDFDNESINLLSTKLIENSDFKKKCEEFIASQGILNPTMQIIASLLDISAKSRVSDFSKLHHIYCGSHFRNVYVPFDQFKSIGDVSKPELFLNRLEVYYLYLMNKKSIVEDLDQISIALASEEESCAVYEAKTQFDISLTPLEDNFKLKIDNKSISSEILDLVFKNNLRIEFEPYSFRNISELANESYFNDMVKVYARNLIENNIEVPKSIYLQNACAILDFLKYHEFQLEKGFTKKFKPNNNIQDTSIEKTSKFKFNVQNNEIICSFETISTSALFSSLDCKEFQKFTDLPQSIDESWIQPPNPPNIDFKDFKWLTDFEKNLILEKQIELYDIDELSNNVLLLKDVSEGIEQFFIRNASKISNKIVRSHVLCRFNLTIDLSLYSDAELKQVINESNCLFPLRSFIAMKKLPKKAIYKLFSSISQNQLDQILTETFQINATDEFLMILLESICSKYEFSHIFNYLIAFSNMKKPTIIKQIQIYFIDLLKSMYIDESYIPLFHQLYAKFLNYEECYIRSNNDKILVLISKCGSALEKETFYGNIKQN